MLLIVLIPHKEPLGRRTMRRTQRLSRAPSSSGRRRCVLTSAEHGRCGEHLRADSVDRRMPSGELLIHYDSRATGETSPWPGDRAGRAKQIALAGGCPLPRKGLLSGGRRCSKASLSRKELLPSESHAFCRLESSGSTPCRIPAIT